jgi:DNA-directed RNA polymerase subunit RPC12/RpoP
MKTYMKFNCIYCGQHMECDPRMAGRQILCPTCLHRIVIPTPTGGKTPIQPMLRCAMWEPDVPLPTLEVPTRYRWRLKQNPALARAE